MKTQVLRCVVVVLLVFLAVACGSGTVENGDSELSLDITSIDQESYLPLTKGIETALSFVDVDKNENIACKISDTASVQNATISVDEGGVVRIRGIITKNNVPILINESLKLKEEGGQIYLLEYEIFADVDDKYYGGDMANHRVYDPPILLLNDESLIVVDDKYVTDSVDVAFDGSEEYYQNSDGSGYFATTSVNDVLVELNVGGMGQVILKDVAGSASPLDVYYITLPSSATQVWYPLWGFVGLKQQIGVAKGIGIVSFFEPECITDATDKPKFAVKIATNALQ